MVVNSKARQMKQLFMERKSIIKWSRDRSLDDVVEIWRGSAAAPSAKLTGVLQLGDRARIGWMAIFVDDPRRRSTAR
jgi:hypothetical protein